MGQGVGDQVDLHSDVEKTEHGKPQCVRIASEKIAVLLQPLQAEHGREPHEK